MACPNNDILVDDIGMPSVMVRIPKQTYAQLGLGESTATHPAWIVDGEEKDAIYISKFQNVVMNGRAYSLPGQDPGGTVSYDDAITACAAKGAGWHIMTRAEWAAIALWCKKNGTQPLGNNDYGKDISENNYYAISAQHSGTDICLAGTGPLTWSHDRTPSGIWDLNGNIYEFNAGIRLVFGELQVLINNNAANREHSQAAESAEWKAIKASDGSYITPSGDGRTAGSIRFSWKGSVWELTDETPTMVEYDCTCQYQYIQCVASISDSAKLLLQALCLFKYDTGYNDDQVYINNSIAERCFAAGGAWVDQARSGLFYIGGADRFEVGAAGGFRAAYVEL